MAKSNKSSKREMPLAEVLGDVGQLAIEKTDVQKPDSVDRPPVFSDTGQGKQDGSQEYEENPDPMHKGIGGTVSGYNPADIVKAPVKPPQPVEVDSHFDTNNKAVKTLVFVGTALAIIGIIVVFFALPLGLILMFVGAALAAVAVLAPIRPSK